MYKTLCIAVLLMPTFALTQGAKSASTGTFASPQIVAKGKLPNQTAPIPTTTIFTPVQTGLYRLSVYATLPVNNQFSGQYWTYNIGWTDDSGPQSVASFLFLNDNVTGQFYNFNNGPNVLGGTTFPFEAKAGTPITHSMTLQGSPDGTAFSLYYVLERLE